MNIRKEDVYSLLEKMNERETKLAYRILREIIHHKINVPEELIKEDTEQWGSVKENMKNNSIAIGTIDSNEFSVEILKDLVSQGYSGDELVEQFEIKSANVQNAIKKMLDEASEIVAGEKKQQVIKTYLVRRLNYVRIIIYLSL
ncbi:hypothetical protein [Virgibacillus doumboii]|uniref:hypothetical protein n=1 Tax=Virgibacillus doumboii TaxID=2697503 RepID=UPI0013DF4CA3|nr:hypothetical protein [Virgibacillus doumboii]